MLTDLSWLEQGQQFPPASERERIEKYKLHEQLFLSLHNEAWAQEFRQMARRLRVSDSKVDTIFNYHQLLSKKIADFICGEAPTIETEGDTDSLQYTLDQESFASKLYEAMIDVTRYGNGIMKNVGQGVSVANPMWWYPIVAPDDLKRITQHVIAYPIEPNQDGFYQKLYVEIHEAGIVRTRIYKIGQMAKKDSYFIGTIGAMGGEEKISDTGLKDYAVQVLTNTTHSGSIYGLDDYTAINTIVRAIMWRIHRADRILDKHSEPSMTGPTSAVERDAETGFWIIRAGNYFRRDSKDDPELSYVTWDGNLDANFKEIEMLFNQLYILTEMGQAFAEGQGDGGAASGRALRLRMTSPLVKAKRIANTNTAPVKRLICSLAAANGIAVDYDTLNITWKDGLPDDEAETVSMLREATNNKAIMSQYTALKRMGLSDEDVEAELEQMREEAATNTPPALSVIDGAMETDDEQETEPGDAESDTAL